MVLFVRRAETRCLGDIGRAVVAREAQVVIRLAAHRTDCRRIGGRKSLSVWSPSRVTQAGGPAMRCYLT